MLNPRDIFAVAAHEYKEGIEAAKEPAKLIGVSPERMAMTIMIQEYSDPRLIRIRSGNTLFTIAALPGPEAFVRSYNGDTADNYINNIVDLIDTAVKMGFVKITAHSPSVVTRLVKAALKRMGRKDLKSWFDSERQMLTIDVVE